jgi:predicted nucleic acid-binding protein
MASLDASVIVDFYLAGKLTLLEELFAGRLLMSDFVNQELIEANLQLTGVRTIALSSTEEWDFFRNLRHGKPGLGLGELGALAVARFHDAILVTNDRQARQAAEEFDVPVHGGLGVLEYAVEVGRLSGLEAVAILEEMICQGAWISEQLAELFKQKVLDLR